MITDIYKNIGILGGTFDPPHKGHVYISNLAIKNLRLEKLFWSVTRQNPLKKFIPSISEKKRIFLCKKIIKKNSKIKILNTKNIKKPDLTINIIKSVKKTLSNKVQLFFIIGADNLIDFHKWQNYKKIFELCTIVIINRPGYKKLAMKSLAAKKFANFKINISILKKRRVKKNEWIYVNNKGLNLSSSRLRISL